MAEQGHEVAVYSPHTHTYKENNWNGVQLIHCYEPQYFGSAGQFIYDLNCIRDARTKHFDVWLMLGYTSSSVWGALYPRNTAVVTNMDGLEWKRSKYSAPVKRFLHFAEKLAVRYSDFLVADSTAIQSYLQQKYDVSSAYIAYGATAVQSVDDQFLNEFGVRPSEYFLVIARMEPENNIAMVLEGFRKARSNRKILVIGNIQTRFGQKMVKEFGNDPAVIFHPAEYDIRKLDALRYYAGMYFHGHSCGGTNPSLLEAMASNALIAAHDNPFNRAVLGNDALYFQSAETACELMQGTVASQAAASMKESNRLKIQTRYNWPGIVSAYEKLLSDSYQSLHR